MKMSNTNYYIEKELTNFFTNYTNVSEALYTFFNRLESQQIRFRLITIHFDRIRLQQGEN